MWKLFGFPSDNEKQKNIQVKRYMPAPEGVVKTSLDNDGPEHLHSLHYSEYGATRTQRTRAPDLLLLLQGTRIPSTDHRELNIWILIESLK